MLLSKLVEGLNAELFGGAETEIENIFNNSKKQVSNGLFVSLDGQNHKGSDYIEEAVRNGAVAVLTQEKLNIDIPQIVVKDARASYAEFSAKLFGNPEKSMKIIGVVGTNGKTSTAKMIESILNTAGVTVGFIGTFGCFVGSEKLFDEMTTPDPEDLYRVLAEMKRLGVRYVVMEVSAHAIALKKVEPIKFEVLVFTNCTQDHLDYFSDMETYSAVKESIFTTEKSKYMVVNVDDELGEKIANKNMPNTVTYGIECPSDVFATLIKINRKSTKFVINLFDELYELKIKLLGKFNVYNSLASIICAFLLKISPDIAKESLEKIENIEGRMEKVGTYNGATIFVDYAHTPDGLEKSLFVLRKITSNNLFVVFGCGGNRDKSKRQIMGRVAGDIADYVVITSDNPRFEDPMAIIDQVEQGVKESTNNYISIKDRKTAISYAIKMLNAGDTLLIAGKGHENYQEIKGERLAFSDKEVVKDLINV